MLRKIVLIAAFGLTLEAQAQIEPQAGQWKTWVISSGTAYRLPAPPDGEGTGAELKWLKDCIANRTPSVMTGIRFWDAGAPGYRWMQMTEKLVVSEGLAGPQQTRALALVAAAIYDATVAAWDSKYVYMRQHPADLDAAVSPVLTPVAAPSYPSEHAATAAAAAAVLAYIFPDQAGLLTGLAQEAGMSRVYAGVAFPSDVTAGMDLGNNVGAAVVNYAKGDGSSRQFTGSFPAATGVWSSATPVTPLAGSWRPWVLATASQFRPVAPPAFASPDAVAQYAAVKNLERNSTTNHLAWFWQPGFFQPWLQEDETEIFQNHLDSNPPRAARVYALQTIAQHDATLACWDAKYTYLELRPPQADPTIVPLFSLPQHPGYPSGHACASAASAVALAFLFPDDSTALATMASEAGTSTFDSAIHTQVDVSTGLVLGAHAGKEVVARAQADGAN